MLMVTHTYPRYPGDGTAPFLDVIVRGLADRGHSIDLVLPHHPDLRSATHQGVRLLPYRYSPVERWSPWGFGSSLRGDARIPGGVVALGPSIVLSLRRRIARLLRENRYDLVHAHWVIPNGWVAAGVARRRGIPLVVSLYGSDVSVAERYTPLRHAARRAFDMAEVVTACSDDLRKRAEKLGASPGDVVTVPHGVDSDVFHPGRVDSSLRDRLVDGRSDTMLVVAAGRLVEVKGFRYLIEAAAQVQGVQVAIIGEGQMRPELERRAQELSAPVTFLGNLRYHGQVADAMATADVVVVPSVVDRTGRVDGLPSTVLEALASGRPVIASRIGGIPEAIADGSNGLLVPEKDPASLAAAIERLKANPAERRRMGEEARRVTVASMTWERTVDRFEACYDGVSSRVS